MPSSVDQRPSAGSRHRSTSSNYNDTESQHSSTPPQQNVKNNKGAGSGQQKHVVGKYQSHAHPRVPSSKVLSHKHKDSGSHTDLRKLGNNRNASTTSLSGKNKTSSHANLRRNRSTADVPKSRPKSSHASDKKRPNSVHFEIGSQSIAAEAEDGWEEASSSASPVLSRSASRLGSAHSSAKPSANNTAPHSPNDSPSKVKSYSVINGRHIADARVITERLLQRTPSNYNTTKMSLATATPTISRSPPIHDHDILPKTANSSGGKDEVVSRFVNGGSSGTPAEASFPANLHNPSPPKASNDEIKRARSMGNLTRRDSSTDREEPESALAPRSRKTSTAHSPAGYIPPQQSRTQQKLWLQRASSNIEPQSGVLGNNGVVGGGGAGYDGRAPGVRSQLEKTGLEYLVVRRYQDPVGKALKRLAQLPGNEKMRRIPNGRSGNTNSAMDDNTNGRGGGYGLSQSLREQRKARGVSVGNGVETPIRTSFEGSVVGSAGTRIGDGDGGDGDDGVAALLRSIWEKNYEMTGSAQS